MNRLLDNFNRILVITKFAYLGDTIVATPFLRELHKAAPQASITLLAGPGVPALMQGCPWLQEVIPYNRKKSGGFCKNAELIRSIRAGSYNAVFVLNRSLHSAFVTAAAGVPMRIGFNTEYRGPLLTVRVAYDWNQPEWASNLDLLKNVGVDPEDGLPELWISQEEREAARAMLASHGVNPASLLITIHPGVHDPETRSWRSDRFAQVADRLIRERKARIIITGTSEERETAEQMAREMRFTPIQLAGETTLRQTMALISLSRLWLGNDGGMLHTAVALGTGTVGIYNPAKYARWAYHSSVHISLVSQDNIIRKRHSDLRKSLDAIGTGTVFKACCDVLDMPVERI